MKRITKLFLLLSLTMATTFAMANTVLPEATGKVIIRTKTVGEKAVRVHLANLQQSVTVVKLENIAGDEFFKEVVKNHNGYAADLNLNAVPEGRYVLKVTQDGEEWAQVIRVDNNGIYLSKVTR